MAAEMAGELEKSVIGKLEIQEGALESSLWLKKL
jgi:hypothetical protein|tara:strand:+ start:1425 stop:1526 length:102 start_codon:yes stop_codon:yes gene_type:complete